MSELKPCPVCGKDAFYDVWLTEFDIFEGNVACNCGIRGIDCNDAKFDCMNEDQLKSALAEHWNNRPYENKIKANAVREAKDHLVRVYCKNNLGGIIEPVSSILNEYIESLEIGDL